MYNKIVLFVIGIAVLVLGAGVFVAYRPIPAPDSLDASQVLGAFGHETSTAADTSQSAPITEPNRAIMSATLHTNKGDITIEFDTTDAPNTVANFEKLASSGFYNGVKFHRVIKGFMIQGGDPLSKDDAHPERWGTGGPGYTFKDEIGPNNHNVAGTIAMANAGPDTNGSQFFINVADNTYLDDKHTVFGRVTAGMDVVKVIEDTPTGQNDRPVDPIVIESISLE